MKRQLIFIAVFALFGCINANAQKSKLKYLLVEIYSDSSFVKLDTITQHSIKVYKVSKTKKREIAVLPQQVFYSKNSKAIGNILLKVDEREFSIKTKKLRNKFAVLKVYINDNVNSNVTDLSIKSGDVIYKLSSCTECHRIQMIQLSVVANSNNNLTTGYKRLDDYIFK